MTTRRGSEAGRRRAVQLRRLSAGLPGDVPSLQRAWWVIGLVVTAIGGLGFQAYPPSRRFGAMEQAVARHDSVHVVLQQAFQVRDSVFELHQLRERLALDSINQQLGQLLLGQCATERDRMARLLYGCARREQ